MATRKIDRSEKNRAFTGALFMILEEVKRWIEFTNDPLAWLLELSGQKNFYAVIRREFTKYRGSIYEREVSVDELKEFCLSLNITAFKFMVAEYKECELADVEALAGEQQQKSGAPIVKEVVEQAPVKVERMVTINSVMHKIAELKPQTDLASIVTSSPLPESNLTTTTPLLWTLDEKEMLKSNLQNQVHRSVADVECAQIFSTIIGSDIIRSEGMKKMVLDNDVYHFGETLYQHLDSDPGFPIVVYAPPNSGKTTANTMLFGDYARDTDMMMFWGEVYSPVVLTNMAQYVKRAYYSIALIPTRLTFEKRCKQRGLCVQSDWYSGMLIEARRATVILRTDAYLSDALKSHPVALQECQLKLKTLQEKHLPLLDHLQSK